MACTRHFDSLQDVRYVRYAPTPSRQLERRVLNPSRPVPTVMGRAAALPMAPGSARPRAAVCRDVLNFRNCREPHACSRGPEAHVRYRKTAPNALFYLVPPQNTLRRGLGGSAPRAQKHAFSTSAPAELHVRAARREKGARRALGRFEPVGSLASLWGVRNRYSELNFMRAYDATLLLKLAASCFMQKCNN